MQNRKNNYTHDEVLQSGRGELFGEGFAQLPLPPMLMFDSIDKIDENGGKHGKGIICASFAIKEDLWFFPCHFQGDPVMPGCLGLDALWQLTGFYLAWLGERGKGRAISTGEVKFTQQITPATKIVSYEVEFKRVMRSKLVLGIADGCVKADGELAFSADNLKVALFN